MRDGGRARKRDGEDSKGGQKRVKKLVKLEDRRE